MKYTFHKNVDNRGMPTLWVLSSSGFLWKHCLLMLDDLLSQLSYQVFFKSFQYIVTFMVLIYLFINFQSIVMYPPPSIYTCTARVWLREIGFSLTYGALMLKTWRWVKTFVLLSFQLRRVIDSSDSFSFSIYTTHMNVSLFGISFHWQ